MVIDTRRAGDVHQTVPCVVAAKVCDCYMELGRSGRRAVGHRGSAGIQPAALDSGAPSRLRTRITGCITGSPFSPCALCGHQDARKAHDGRFLCEKLQKDRLWLLHVRRQLLLAAPSAEHG